MDNELHEYAFDVSLNAVVRVKAQSEEHARLALESVLDAVSPSPDFLDGYNTGEEEVRITEFSLSSDDSVFTQGAELIEIDQKPV